MKKFSPFLIILLTIFPFRWGFGQTPTPPCELLRRGLVEFRAGKYRSAKEDFQLLTKITEGNCYIDASLYLLAKTNLRLKKYAEAAEALKTLRNHFPESFYYNYASYLNAEVLYAQKKDEQAFRVLFSLLYIDSDPRLKALAQDKLMILLNSSSTPYLVRLKNSLEEKEQALIDNIIKERKQSRKIVILTNPDDEVNAYIIVGARLALDLYNSAGNQFNFQVVELEGDELKDYLSVKDLGKQPLQAVISLVRGSQSVIVAAAGGWLEVPFFLLRDDTPELWKISENIWQLQPDLQTMGWATADVMIKNLKLNSFVTLSPLDDNRVKFTDAFVKRAVEMGVEIVAQEWYYSQSLDLGKNFSNLRRIGFQYAFYDSLKMLQEKDSLFFDIEVANLVPDSLRKPVDEYTFQVDTLTDDLLNVLWNNHKRIQQMRLRLENSEIDSSDIPLYCYDGFVFPLYADELGMYLPQLAFYYFKTNLITLLSALSPQDVFKYREYLTNLKAVGWGRRERDKPSFIDLSQKFIKMKGSAPTDEEVLGYDTMNFVLNFLQNGEKDIISQAQGEISLKGISFDFVFHSGQRVNQSLCFYGFNGKDLVPIEGKIYK